MFSLSPSSHTISNLLSISSNPFPPDTTTHTPTQCLELLYISVFFFISTYILFLGLLFSFLYTPAETHNHFFYLQPQNFKHTKTLPPPLPPLKWLYFPSICLSVCCDFASKFVKPIRCQVTIDSLTVFHTIGFSPLRYTPHGAPLHWLLWVRSHGAGAAVSPAVSASLPARPQRQESRTTFSVVMCCSGSVHTCGVRRGNVSVTTGRKGTSPLCQRYWGSWYALYYPSYELPINVM